MCCRCSICSRTSALMFEQQQSRHCPECGIEADASVGRKQSSSTNNWYAPLQQSCRIQNLTIQKASYRGNCKPEDNEEGEWWRCRWPWSWSWPSSNRPVLSDCTEYLEYQNEKHYINEETPFSVEGDASQSFAKQDSFWDCDSRPEAN